MADFLKSLLIGGAEIGAGVLLGPAGLGAPFLGGAPLVAGQAELSRHLLCDGEELSWSLGDPPPAAAAPLRQPRRRRARSPRLSDVGLT